MASMDSALTTSLSDGVEAAIKEVIAHEEDELDLPDFDPVDYINRQFATEDALATLPAFIGRFDREIKALDESIFESVREQSRSGVHAGRDLEAAKSSITELFGKIRDIRGKAEQSEVMVRDICRDIRQLDVAKRHLTTTIITLKRVQMLVTAVDRLQANSSSGQYENAGQLLQATSELFANFKDYASVPKIAELMATVTRVKADLRDRILRDFDSLTELGAAEAVDLEDDLEPATSLETVKQACEVVDALEGDLRDRLILTFCSKQLAPYESICRGEEARSLDSVDRRYGWFRRALRDLEARFSTVFPEHWHVPFRFCLEFCTMTRRHVEEMLGQYADPDSAPADALVKSLQRTLGFESEIKRRFEEVDKDGQLVQIISKLFIPYMGAYVAMERSMFETLIGGASSAEDVDGGGSLPVLRSSPQLFLQIRNCVNRCIQLSTGQVFFQLSDAIKEAIKSYADMLLSRLPTPTTGSPYPGDTYKITVEQACDICYVINTAEYCAETLPQLQESLRAKVDEPFKERISLEEVAEYFQFDVIRAALGALSSGTACMLDAGLDQLSKMNWVTLAAVGDNSEYVGEMTAALQAVMPAVRKKLSALYFNQFCDKVARAFLPRYMSAIYRAKRIAETGSQQMLLDAHAIKTLLLRAPVLVNEDDEEDEDEEPAPAPAMYVKYVTREVPRVELLLKLISTPKDRFADSIQALWPDASASDLQRVMELKNMKRSEQTEVLEALGLTPGSDRSGVRNVVGRLRSGLDTSASALTKAFK